MRLTVLAVGLMRGMDEAPLYENYAKRIAQSGRHIGFDGLHLTEIKEHKTASAKLSAALDAHQGLIVLLDETGASWSSRQFADKLADWRDAGRGDILFVIGPADGFDAAIKARGDVTLCLGKMTWPHMLSRIMLAEQLWRAISILSGHPYHRD
jgi:23S rRNA (pseudouridine1915-N3)-methyltransferase